MQSLANIIRVGTSRRMRGTGHVACVRNNTHTHTHTHTYGGTTEGKSPFWRQTCRWTIILERMWQEQEVNWIESSKLGHARVVGRFEQSWNLQGIYLMDVKGVYSLPRNDSAPCSQLNSWLALSSGVFIPLQEPTSPTQHTTLTLPTAIRTWVTVKYLFRNEQ